MEGELISKREVYEAQKPEYLKRERSRLLGKISLIEAEIFLLNDVLGGMGEDNVEEIYGEEELDD